jgi:putative autoinducer-2 (AI-2) aldolase
LRLYLISIDNIDNKKTIIGDFKMADLDGVKEAKNFYTDVPQKTEGFFLKGSNSLDWGMKNRLSRIFNAESGRTVMLAVDHGYFQGPTTGLERIDLNILPLVPYADTLMLTRGILRSIVPPSQTTPIVLRASGGSSILKELSNEDIAVNMEDNIRLNVCAMAVQVFIGGEYEKQSVINMTRLIDKGTRYGIPTMAVTAVGKDMARDARYFRLATRLCAELGAHYIKSYYIEDGFESITSCCPVPIVIAGGKKMPEADALKMAYNAIQQGASGVDMGRNIFQSESPTSMIQAVSAVVHKDETPERAFEMYNDLKAGS